jgi:hypothetical protein
MDIKWLWSIITGWWPKIKTLRMAPYFAAIVFIILVLVFGRKSGLTPEEIAGVVLGIGLLVAFLYFVNAIAVSPSIKAFISWAFAILSVMAAFAFVSNLFWRWIRPVAPPPILYADPQVHIETHFANKALVRPNVPTSATEYEQTNNRMKIWRQWINDGAGPTRITRVSPELSQRLPEDIRKQLVVPPVEVGRHQLLVLESPSPFTADYTEFSAAIEFDNNQQIKLLDGVAFLISNDAEVDYHPTYRQCRFKIEKDSLTNANNFTLAPKAQEKLFLIIQLDSRTDDPLPSKESGYGVRILKR